jgi:hypothetical protein
MRNEHIFNSRKEAAAWLRARRREATQNGEKLILCDRWNWTHRWEEEGYPYTDDIPLIRDMWIVNARGVWEMFNIITPTEGKNKHENKKVD